MGEAKLSKDVRVLRTFTDVLCLTGENGVLPEVKRLLRHKKLSFCALPIEQYHLIRDRLDLVGTVVIDTDGLGKSRQQKLAPIIESLEMANVGVTLLTGRVQVPVRSFALAPPDSSFSVAKKAKSVSLDDLWGRISVNLAYRKQGSGITARPAAPLKQAEGSFKNPLAQQLKMTGALVDTLAEQLRLAGLVQRDFLPAHLPNCPEVQWAATFLPAEWVSGDIYDVVRLDEQHIGFYIADAVGHAMPAALLTIFVKQALVMRETRGNNYRIFSPAEVVKHLNVRMSGQKLSGYQFATCCYCLLNTKTRQLTFARAGHPYPVLIRAGGPPEQIEVRGSLLGVFGQAEYIQRTIQLEPGDKLLLYSDGADSFIGSFDDQADFGFTEAFCQIKDLPVTEMMERLNTLAQNRQVDPAQIDDITVVGMEIL